MTRQYPGPWRRLGRPAAAAGIGALLLALAGCAMLTPPAPEPVAEPVAETAPPPPPPPPPAPPPPAAPPPVMPFDAAVLTAANHLLSRAVLPPTTPHEIVIDPLIDGVTGVQNAATQAMGAKIVELIKVNYPQYQVLDFNAASVQRAPLVLVGTFTGVNAERKSEGLREQYRICLALADLKTGKLIGKGLAFAETTGVDPTPRPFFRDAPAVLEDGATTGYVRTCQGTKAGDPIHPLYVDRIVTATTIAEAIDAYDKQQYADALKLYETARAGPGGAQLRVFTGLYLTNLRLGRLPAASAAFGDIVDQGLASKRLGVKFLFKPGTAAMWTDSRVGPVPYSLWLREIANRSARSAACLGVIGHTSPTGPEPLNDRLSLRRAETVQRQLERLQPSLRERLTASGMGSRETLIGNRRDDLSDALDRRVELKVLETC